MYSEDDMLMLSGIQHYRFCPRQWALIHLEQQWDDNRLTIEGQLLHKHVDDPFYRQKCGDYITLRSVNIASHELGLYGISDAIELLPSDDIRIQSSIRNIQGDGCLYLWNTSTESQRRTRWTRCNWQPKPCVLKKCIPYMCHTAHSSMVRFVIGLRWKSLQDCVTSSGNVQGQCTLYIKVGRFRWHLKESIATSAH